MQKVRVEDAIGMVLGHDLTKIVPGEFKGAAFKKGHIIKKDDVTVLKDMGKNHLYVIDLKDDLLHEDDAAIRIGKAISGIGLYFEGPSEGKVNIKSKVKGILKINLKSLEAVNNIDSIILATLHNNSLVDKDRIVAATRIIPLAIDKERIEEIEKICTILGKVIEIKEIKSKKVGIVVTGSEVYEGRITDKFGPVIKDKALKYGAKFIGIKYSPDEKEEIERAIMSFIQEGAEVVLTAGGMSVDADDVSPIAIRNISNEVITYGSPVLPGAMFMLAYTDKAAILGVPACGMYFKTTVLDLIFPRVLAEEKLCKKDIVSLGHGGLCLGCKECRYPICPFGK